MKQGFKIIAFDLDNTLTKGYSWALFHKITGVSYALQNEWRKKYYLGQINYAQWISLIETKYRTSHKTKPDFLAVTKKIPFKKNTLKTISALKNHYPLHIVSSSIDFYVREAAKKLGITAYHANHSFVFNDQGKFEKITYQAPEAEAKVQYLKSLCLRNQLKPKEICFVGDSMGDAAAFEFTQRGILMGDGNPELKKSSWKQIQIISEILPLLLNP